MNGITYSLTGGTMTVDSTGNITAMDDGMTYEVTLDANQSIPIGGIASVTIGMEILPATKPVNEIIEIMTGRSGVSSLKILGREDKV